jgi:hypothetical protein
MAFELYGMLAGNVSPLTGENIKPAYGGDEEAFLKRVITPIYKVIEKVHFVLSNVCFCPFYASLVVSNLNVIIIGSCEEQDDEIKAFSLEKL